MKIKNLLYFAVFILLSASMKAQSGEAWKPLLVSPAGTNSFNGVEAYYEPTTCNGSEKVLLLFINHDNYTVKIGWKDVVTNKDGQSLNRGNVTDSISIAPNAQVKGDCSGSGPMVVKLSDFGISMVNFNEFMTSNFDFVIIH